MFALEKGQKNRILRGRAKEVEGVDEEIRECMRKMKSIMREENGIGLAAPQIGLPIRVFVAELPAKSASGTPRFYAFANPEIVKKSSESDTLEEGCLSLPGLFGTVPRARKVVLRGLDQRGKKVEVKASGLLARIFQHEMDHLNGALFIDRAKEVYEYRLENKNVREADAH